MVAGNGDIGRVVGLGLKQIVMPGKVYGVELSDEIFILAYAEFIRIVGLELLHLFL